VAAVLNAALFAVIAWKHPQYLRDPLLNNNPDARGYVVLGENIVLRHVFSRCRSAPYVPDALRTPVYPVVVGIMQRIAGPAGVYVFQAICHVIACAVLYWLVADLFGSRAGFWASLILALDVTLAVANFEAMSEPLYLLLNLAGLACLLPPLVDPSKGSIGRAAAGGLLLALATLTRPTGLYVPIIVALTTIGALIWIHPRGRLIGQGAVALAAAALPVSLWIARNWYVFSVPRLTTADAVMLVYYFAAGGYQINQEITLEQAQKQISAEFHLPPEEATNNHWITDESVQEMDSKLRRAVRPLLLKYPQAIAQGSLRGIAKAAVSHNVGNYALMTGRDWTPPGMAAAITGDRSSISRLIQNPIDMVLLLAGELSHLMAIWVLGAIGLILALVRRPTRGPALITGIVFAYFCATLAIVGMECYWRYRVPQMPLVYVFAGVAAAAIAERLPVRHWAKRLEEPKR
jgi:4-amino-4-deoxy-L-arabinose transferase-like glycosyltransferase